MKFCIAFEVAGPCCMPKKDHSGKIKRYMFLWFSIIYMPYKWTEFIDRFYNAVVAIKKESDDEGTERDTR